VSRFRLSWLKDGRTVENLPRIRTTKLVAPSAPQRSDGSDHAVLVAESNLVVSNVQKEDSGVYQCVIAFNEAADGAGKAAEVQASAELRLGGNSRNSTETQHELSLVNLLNFNYLRAPSPLQTETPFGIQLQTDFSFSIAMNKWPVPHNLTTISACAFKKPAL
jgi:hypothetical protein